MVLSRRFSRPSSTARRILCLETLEARIVPSFATPISYNVGSVASSYNGSFGTDGVASLDLNGDGSLDLAVVHTGEGTVNVLLNQQGNATFATAVPYATGLTDAIWVSGTDLNADGIIDLAVEGSAGGVGFISVLLGNGNGTFRTAVPYVAGPGSRGGIVFGDYNTDGNVDMATTQFDTGAGRGQINILYGNGNGTFRNSFNVPLPFVARSLTVDDFNRDGIDDFAVVGGEGYNNQLSPINPAGFVILLGQGNGAFQQLAINISPPTGGPGLGTVNPGYIISGDFNNDGLSDIVVSLYDHNIDLFLGNGNGTFQAARGFDTGVFPRSLVTGDVDGDGNLDLVVTCIGDPSSSAGIAPGAINILLGRGNGTFQAPSALTNFPFPGWAILDDFNADGRLDLVATRAVDGHSANVFVNLGGAFPPTAGATARPGLAIGTGSERFAVGTNQGISTSVAVFDGTLTQVGQFAPYSPGFTGGARVGTGDLNGDGVDDIVTAAGPGGGPHIEAFDGVTFQLIASFFAYTPAFQGGVSLAVADVNGDGVADLILGAGPGGGPHVKVVDGGQLGNVNADGTISESALLASFFAYSPDFRGGVTASAADFDLDGRAELLFAAGPGGGPHVKVIDGTSLNLINADGTISDDAIYTKTFYGSFFFLNDPSFAGGVVVAAGDVNNDGIRDIAVGVASAGPAIVQAISGTGLGLIQSIDVFPGFTGGVTLGLVDTQGNGTPNALFVGQGPGGSRVRLLDATTGFELLNRVIFPEFVGGVWVG